MLVYEYKLDGSKKQYAAIDEAIHTVQFIRNNSLPVDRYAFDQLVRSEHELQSACPRISLRSLPQFYGSSSGCPTCMVCHLSNLRQLQEKEARQGGISNVSAQQLECRVQNLWVED